MIAAVNKLESLLLRRFSPPAAAPKVVAAMSECKFLIGANMADMLLLLYRHLGIRLDGCICLTTPTDPKVSPKTVYELLKQHLPSSRVKRDQGVSRWEDAVGSKQLTADQIRAATMDAFAATLLGGVVWKEQVDRFSVRTFIGSH